ncbi:MAG: tRNA uridine-5-carboxymethylaminomethyl(34) synthesis GTPase MnmE [Bacteriovoracia bacterium]
MSKKSYFNNDTICAVATSLASDAGVGIIRLSGSQALFCAQQLTKGFENPEPRYLHRIEIQDKGIILDDGLAVFFDGKNSFTGEPIVELQLHGGRYLLQKILGLILEKTSARLALPGEFSFRAVKNNKLSLGEALALNRLIHAQSDFEVTSARRKFSSNQKEFYISLAKRIRDLLAKTELSIDFSDQDVEVISASEMKEVLENLLIEAKEQVKKVKLSKRVAKGFTIVLAGEPNAGKSTLFNAILSEDRAIVSEIAGTTRDIITEDFNLGPYRINLADTAGFRETQGVIESDGIARARSLLNDAEVILFVLDSTKKDIDLRAEIENLGLQRFIKKLVIVSNKSDIVRSEHLDLIRKQASELQIQNYSVSATKALGVAMLLKGICNELDKRYQLSFDVFLHSETQEKILAQAVEKLEEAFFEVSQRGVSSPEILSSCLFTAAHALSVVAGETTPDSVLTQIFNEFCIGK